MRLRLDRISAHLPAISCCTLGLLTACILAGSPALLMADAATHGSTHHSTAKTSGKSGKPRKEKSQKSAKTAHAKETHPKKASKPPRVGAASSHRGDRCITCDRDKHGRIVRSEDAKKAFEKGTGFPHGRKGYVIDHIVPLACGGADLPSNMQWQTIAEATAKDKVERATCR